MLIETKNSIELLCLYLAQHILHQIRHIKFSNNFLILISSLSPSRISVVEFQHGSAVVKCLTLGFEPHHRHCVVVFEEDTFILA